MKCGAALKTILNNGGDISANALSHCPLTMGIAIPCALHPALYVATVLGVFETHPKPAYMTTMMTMTAMTITMTMIMIILLKMVA